MSRLTRHPGLLVWLTAVWVGLWGSVTVANVLGGLAVALVLLLSLPLTDVPDESEIRPGALLRFVGHFAVDLVQASLQVALLVVRPRATLRQAVLAVPVRCASDRLLTLLANAISLTPGTLTLEVDRPRSTLYVHVLDVGAGPGGVERMRGDILRIERLAILAVGSPPCRLALTEDLQAGTEVPQ
ncbi:MAG: Na+/H+ antiporter subunit E [Mycobacteriales bacterium]